MRFVFVCILSEEDSALTPPAPEHDRRRCRCGNRSWRLRRYSDLLLISETKSISPAVGSRPAVSLPKLPGSRPPTAHASAVMTRRSSLTPDSRTKLSLACQVLAHSLGHVIYRLVFGIGKIHRERCPNHLQGSFCVPRQRGFGPLSRDRSLRRSR
jgi:hypothetical protein